MSFSVKSRAVAAPTPRVEQSLQLVPAPHQGNAARIRRRARFPPVSSVRRGPDPLGQGGTGGAWAGSELRAESRREALVLPQRERRVALEGMDAHQGQHRCFALGGDREGPAGDGGGGFQVAAVQLRLRQLQQARDRFAAGVAGNIESTLATIGALDGLRGHLTHVQFHCYGNEGPKKFSSAALRLAEAVNVNPNVSIDVGQILFGQTVTASGDTMRQHANADLGSPRKWIGADIECAQLAAERELMIGQHADGIGGHKQHNDERLLAANLKSQAGFSGLHETG